MQHHLSKLLHQQLSHHHQQQYNFIQLHIKANKIVSAQAGLDSRKAPDVLQTTQLEGSFS
ncbi:hypothetical protein IAF53_20710 [Acinetobacter baumannii]|nr:hypothetical protein [Acinetobacter baumannii]